MFAKWLFIKTFVGLALRGNVGLSLVYFCRCLWWARLTISRVYPRAEKWYTLTLFFVNLALLQWKNHTFTPTKTLTVRVELQNSFMSNCCILDVTYKLIEHKRKGILGHYAVNGRLHHLQLCMCKDTYVVRTCCLRGVSPNSVVTTQSRLVRVTCRCHDHVPAHLSDALELFPLHAMQ